MDDDPIEAYQAKRKELQAATALVEKIVKIVIAAAGDLRDWRTVMVNGSSGFPPHLSASSRSIDADTWPSGQEIGQILSKWHSLSAETQRAYERIADGQRAGIRPPPA
ncbi:MAG TPA: hypothetical protein VIB79_25060 [Candidatus Binatia bacterium]|jgi:hypothetical protein